jgi:microsomal epoxide hydrolase
MPLEASLSLFPGERIPRERWRDTAQKFAKPLLYAVTPQYLAQAESLKSNRPATRVEIFESAGHALFVDEAERFNAVLADFILRSKAVPVPPD